MPDDLIVSMNSYDDNSLFMIIEGKGIKYN